MSVFVQNEEGDIIIYEKGADVSMIPLLSSITSDQLIQEQDIESLNKFAR